MDKIQPSPKARMGKSLILAVTVALAVSWSAATIAASSKTLPCNQDFARDLQSLNVKVDELAISAVDHEIAAVDSAAIESSDMSIHVESTPTDTAAAPTLDLTPRVTSILDAVFNTHTQVSKYDDSVDDQATARENEATDVKPMTAPVTLIDKEYESKGFQYQMYRKDI